MTQKRNPKSPWKAMKIDHHEEIIHHKSYAQITKSSASSPASSVLSGRFLILALALFAGNGSRAILGDETESAGGSCHLREMEFCCVSGASLFQNPNGIPIDGPEFKRVCENLEESENCHEDYAERCMTKNQHLVISLFTGEISNMAKEFCKSGSVLRTNYAKHASCFRKIQKKYQAECIADLQVALAPIHKLGVGARLSTGCCAINRFKDCIFSKIEKECGDEAADFVESLLIRAFGNAFNNLCREYDPDSEPCRMLLPKSGTIPYNGRNTSAISRIISSYGAINMNLS